MARTAGRKPLFFTAAASLLLGGAILWWQWTPLLVWVHIRGLSRAPVDERESWVQTAVRLQDVMLPALIGCLREVNERACDNAGLALTRIAQSWDPDDARRAALARRLAQGLPDFSPAGRRAALATALELLSLAGAVPSELAVHLAKLVAQATHQDDAAVRTRALDVVMQLVEREPTADVLAACRDVAGRCLQDGRPEVRLHAIRVAQCPGLELLEHVVPLLDDAAAEVRRAALLAVGAARDAVADDELLRWLHDPDADVQALCEKALRSRGLQDQHLKLGRLLTDRRPGTRLQVLEQLRRAHDLEPGVWLRRLSHDSDPAVRAAAVRAATEQPFVDLRDRLEQMAQNDPSTTVRQLAQFYLRAPRPEREP